MSTAICRLFNIVVNLFIIIIIILVIFKKQNGWEFEILVTSLPWSHNSTSCSLPVFTCLNKTKHYYGYYKAEIHSPVFLVKLYRRIVFRKPIKSVRC